MNYPIVLYPEEIRLMLAELSNKTQQISSLTTTEQVQRVRVQPREQSYSSKTSLLLLGVWFCWLLGAIACLLAMLLVVGYWIAITLVFAAWSCFCLAVYLELKHLAGDRRQKSQGSRESGVGGREDIAEEQGAEEQGDEDRLSALLLPQVIQELTKKRVNPVSVKSGARQGVSEEYFLQVCRRYFDQVVQGAAFKIPSSKFRYSADFLVFHSATGLGIDVEIDEPYALLSKQPTHCIDQPEDRRRNQFFLEWGWVVVRFTELQVVKAPESCCQVIAQAIASITGDSSYLEQLAHFPDLLPQKRWTSRQAIRWASLDYRLSYLPDDIVGDTSKVRAKRNRRKRKRRR